MHVSATSMKVNINRLMVDPEFYIFNFSEDTESSEFLIVTEKALDIAPFIDIRLQPYARGQFSVSTRELAELVKHAPGPRPELHFILHHAFVCSTLLARCLSQSETFFSLKEPHVIRRLADFRRSMKGLSPASGGMPFSQLLRTHLGLLAKNYSKGEKVVVKATNVANNLLPDLAAASAGSRFLYLFSSLEQFLVSNLKKAADTREKIPSLFRLTASDGDFYSCYPDFLKAENLSFLQHCALLWLASNHNVLNMARNLPPHQWATLPMQVFLESPRDAVSGVSRFFGHTATGMELDTMTSANLLSRHAKDPNLAYDHSTRERENAAIRLRFGQEISGTCRWLKPFCDPDTLYERLENQALTSTPPSVSHPVSVSRLSPQTGIVKISSHN